MDDVKIWVIAWGLMVAAWTLIFYLIASEGHFGVGTPALMKAGLWIVGLSILSVPVAMCLAYGIVWAKNDGLPGFGDAIGKFVTRAP